MKKLKRPLATVALTLLVSAPALADGTCVPGQIDTPPCAAALREMDPTDPGQIETPPAQESQTSLAEIAANVLMSMLPLF
jgi:hypothetical protein